MANDEVRIKIKIDTQSQELVLLKQQVQDVSKSFDNADSYANTFMKRINLAGHIYAAYQIFSNTLGAVAKQGFEVNKEMQKLTNSLTMSSAVMISNNDIYGNAISIQDKYRLAQIDAAKSTELLQKANIATPHSMKETVQIYDAMYLGMRKVGATTSDMVEITEKLSIAAGNKIGFDAFLSAMDGISTGTVQANSEMGRFLSSIGLSNEAIKNSSDVVKLFKDKLSDFKAIEDYDTKMSNLTNSIDMFSKNLMKIPFDYLESKIPSVARLFDSWAKSINEINIYLTNASNLSTYDELINKQYQLLGKIAEVKKDKFIWDGDQKSQIKELNSELEIVFQKLAKIKQDEDLLKNVVTNVDLSEIDKLVNDTLNPYGAKIDEVNSKWLTNFNILVKNGKDTTKYLEAWSRALDDVNQKEDDKNKKDLDSLKKIATERNKAYLDISQIGMSEYNKSLVEITEKTNSWIEAGVRTNDALIAQSKLIDELNTKKALDTAKEDLSYYERLVQLKADSYEKEIELANISYTQKTLDIKSLNRPLEEKQKLIDLESELYSKTLERIAAEDNIKNIDSTLESQTSLLDTQLELLDATDAWGNSFGGIAGNIANISSAMGKLGKIEIANKKQQLKLDSDLAKTKEKYGKHSIEYVEMENEAIMSKSQLAVSSQKAELDGWGNIAGAMSGAFKEGSDAALAFRAIQIGIATVSAGQALITAWADPTIPAIVKAGYVATVAANVAQLLSMIGGGSGGGGSTASVPSVADTNQENLDHSNKMITDRLDRQIELLEQLNLQGSAEKLKNISAGIQFDYEQSSARNTIRKKMEENLGSWQGKDQVSIFNSLLSNVTYEGDLVDYFMSKSPVKVWQDYANRTTGGMGAWFSQYMDVSQRQFEEMQNEFQQSIADFTGAVVSSIQTLQSTNDNLKETFDEITESNKYAEIKLKDSFDRVNSLRGTLSFSQFLEKEIENIAKLDNELSDKNIALLLSQDIKDMRAQVELVNEISAKTGVVFENGAEDVLNYIDAIDIVSETLVKSRENIKSFENSFKSDFTLANEMAKNLGLKSLATDLRTLNSLFVYLKSDTLGLVDAELELLQANKSLIENYNDIVSQIDNILSPKTLSLGAVKVEDVTLETANDFLDQLNEAKEAEINRATTAINAEKERLQNQKQTAQAQKQAADTLKKAFENTTKSLNATYKNIINQTSLADSFNIAQYQKLYNQIDAGITAGTDISDLTSDFNSYATSYAAYIKDNATTQEEYDRKMKILANEVKGLAGKAETATLSDLDNRLNDANNNLANIDSSILSLDANLQRKIDSINATYISQTQLLKNALEYSFKNNASSTQIDYSTLVEDAYKTVLGRGSDVEGKKYWLEELNSKRVTAQDLYTAIANAAVKFDINSYAASTGDYSIETITMLSNSMKNAQKYLADNISKTTTTQTTNYFTQNSNDKALDEVVKELQRLNIISAANAENTKQLLKTNKQTLIAGLQG